MATKTATRNARKIARKAAALAGQVADEAVKAVGQADAAAKDMIDTIHSAPDLRDVPIPTEDTSILPAAIASAYPRYADLAVWHVVETVIEQMRSTGNTDNAAWKYKETEFPVEGLPSVRQCEEFMGRSVKEFGSGAIRRLFNGWRPALEPLDLEEVPPLAGVLANSHSTLIMQGDDAGQVKFFRQPTFDASFFDAELRIRQGTSKQTVLSKLDAWRRAVEAKWEDMIEGEDGEIGRVTVGKEAAPAPDAPAPAITICVGDDVWEWVSDPSVDGAMIVPSKRLLVVGEGILSRDGSHVSRHDSDQFATAFAELLRCSEQDAASE